ncbi:type I-MYXAN CRISPR-associated endonuclease Cas1 [filamentous cyanobacterium LEGE 11480]|uniref:CRISPR-associated endonuclease Cas1 n=1 Tax=Romeriopsis navalis LEGE 11480 TaxID=2777977 RepID=A0A928VI19_9CYAN|nr:type I-MYXAN CRISPR-associated endonuclease Cas1 [Romeriopsis navalis]MBE9028725.1 type I-MYXAN CRISPR-associated endonuclease Cas1 [Romeriopsis navalis LEGE 11480]
MNATATLPQTTLSPTLKVSALHAFAYCPRLFYLEEVEALYTQDAAVFAGRTLHEDIDEQETGEWEDLFLESVELGLRGRVDALRKRDGQIIPYEHKRGRAHRDEHKQPQAWESDRLQILAYACLLESALGVTIVEGRVRYHSDNVLVHVPLDDKGRAWVREKIAAARKIQSSTCRPPVTENERLCTRCSLVPVCLPEEARLANDRSWQPVRLFPEDDTRQVVHVLEPGTRVGRTGEQIKIVRRNEKPEVIPARQVGQVVLHSFSQISTQALHFCSDQEIGVHLVSGGGRYLGSFDTRQGSIQRRIRQYEALVQPEVCLELARQLVLCRGRSQRKFLMRAVRGRDVPELAKAIAQMKAVLKQVGKAGSIASLLGIEGNLARLYFDVLDRLLKDVPDELRFSHRNRRPPKDRVNAMLSFGYAMLLKDVMNAVLAVGLEPALGFYHQPRTQAPPLALDLMEIFRVPLVDMIVVSSINRGMWDVSTDFVIRGQQVWLSNLGRRKFVKLYEERKAESWKHPTLDYSLTYRRLLELEVRLLEKEWMGEAGLFGRLVVR